LPECRQNVVDDAADQDLVVTLGCGDITRVHDDWLAEDRRRAAS